MKKSIQHFSLLILIIGLLSCTQEKENQKVEEQYVIMGELTGFPDGTTIYLKNLSTDANIDSAKVQNNRFQMVGNLENPPEQLWLTSQIENRFLYTNLLIGNDSINIKADVNDFPWHVNAAGSRIHDEYTYARNLTKNYWIQRDSLTTYFLSLEEDERQKKSKQIWNRIGKIDSIVLTSKLQYVKDKATYTSLIDLGNLKEDLPRDTIRSIFDKYPEDLKNSKYGNILKVFLEKKTLAVGDTYYDFEGVNQYEENLKFSTIHDSSKFTLIDFTSTYCGPCILANEELSSIHQSLKDSLTIVSFSGDPKKETWLYGVKRDSITWNFLWDGKGRFSETAIGYGIHGFPTYVLVDPQGTIVDKWVGYSKGGLEGRLNKHL